MGKWDKRGTYLSSHFPIPHVFCLRRSYCGPEFTEGQRQIFIILLCPYTKDTHFCIDTCFIMSLYFYSLCHVSGCFSAIFGTQYMSVCRPHSHPDQACSFSLFSLIKYWIKNSFLELLKSSEEKRMFSPFPFFRITELNISQI